MAKKRNEEKVFFKIFVQKLWPKRGLEDLRKKQGILGGCGKTQNLGGLYFSSGENEQ